MEIRSSNIRKNLPGEHKVMQKTEHVTAVLYILRKYHSTIRIFSRNKA
jgi:hypothetical protein